MLLGFKKPITNFANKSFFEKMFPVRFYQGEDGAVGGADTGADTAPSPEMSEVFSGVPKWFADSAVENDPEFKSEKEDVEAGRAAKNKKSTSSEKPNENEDDSTSNTDNAGTDDASSANDTDKDEFENLEFQDDVIPGIKGEDLKKLGFEGVKALTEFHEKNAETTTKLTELQTTLSKYENDPVIKAQMDRINSGKTFQIRDVTPAEQTTAVDMLIKQLDFTQEEAEKAFDLLKAGFKTIAQQQAQDLANESLIKSEVSRKTEEVITKSRSIIHGLGKFNKDLQFKETDPNKFWIKQPDGKFVLNEKHPEADKYKKTVVPIYEALAKGGFSTYEQINKLAEEFGEEAVYSLAAKKLGLPVIMNADSVIQKRISEALLKKFKPWLKANGPDGLPADGGSSVSSSRKEKGSIVGGIDMDRIVKDDNYVEELIRQKPHDEKWRQKVYDAHDTALRRSRKK